MSWPASPSPLLRRAAIGFAALSALLSVPSLAGVPSGLAAEPHLWLASGGGLDDLFGPWASTIDLAALLAVGLLALRLKDRPRAMKFAVAAGLALVLAQVVSWLSIQPMQALMAEWTPASMPADFAALQGSWNRALAAVALLKLGALYALWCAVTSEPPERERASA